LTPALSRPNLRQPLDVLRHTGNNQTGRQFRLDTNKRRAIVPRCPLICVRAGDMKPEPEKA
jgi:hypothetical protein